MVNEIKLRKLFFVTVYIDHIIMLLYRYFSHIHVIGVNFTLPIDQEKLAGHGFPETLAARLPKFYDLEDYHRGDGHRQPHKHCFQGKTGPSTDKKPHHGIGLVTPPAVRSSQSCFPNETNEQEEEERHAEGSPVDRVPGRGEKSDRRNHRTNKEIGEVPGETLRIPRKEFLVNHCQNQQYQTNDHRAPVKGEQPGDLVGSGFVVRKVIGAYPVLVAPDIEQKHHEKA